MTYCKEIRSTVQLDGLDQREIDTQAAEMARRDLAAGRISASGLGKAIEDYRPLLPKEKIIARNTMTPSSGK